MTLDREELCALQEEMLLRIALSDIAREEAQALEGDLGDAALNPRTVKILERALRRAQWKKCLRHTLPRAARAVAALVLAGYLALTAALFASTGAREKFLTLLIPSAPSFEGLGLKAVHTDRAVAPEGWTEKYFPEHIPEGWKIESFDPVFGDVVYRLDGDHIFQFGVYGENARTGINTEGAVISRVSLNGAMATVAENPLRGFTWVTWPAGDRTIVIYIDADLSTALDIAASVREIDGGNR